MANINGTAGRDQLVGSPGDDLIKGLAGSDNIFYKLNTRQLMKKILKGLLTQILHHSQLAFITALE